jgi:hypothetical protein
LCLSHCRRADAYAYYGADDVRAVAGADKEPDPGAHEVPDAAAHAGPDADADECADLLGADARADDVS